MIYPEYDVEPLPARARAFIDGLDRSVLGRFAVDEQGLYLLHLGELYRFIAVALFSQNNRRREYDAVWEKITENEKAIREIVTDYTNRTVFLDELYFWWHSSDNGLLQGNSERGYAPIERNAWMELLSTSPVARHEYFAVGLRDIDFIDRCIAVGVDPEMALTL